MNILLIEDNPDQKELINRAFQRFDPHCLVEMVREGSSALTLLKKNHFDAIVLDYSLPMMNGLEVLGHIQIKYSGIPVIMVTGQGDEGVAVEAMKRGAYDYLIKTGQYYENIPRIVQKAIEKNHLKKKLEKSSLKLRMLQEISLSMTTERNPEVLADTLVKGVGHLLETEGSILFLINPETLAVSFSASFGIDMAWASFNSNVETIGLLGYSILNRKPFMTEEPEGNPLWSQTPSIKPSLRNMISVPLIQQGKIGGVLIGLNKKNREPFVQEDQDALLTLAINAGVAFDNARFIQEKEKQAITDSLTGIYNRLEFQKRIVVEFERSLRNQKSFSLLMIDIDHFKRINDTYGHPAGDTMIIEIVKILQGNIRNFDFIARYGGEEFVIMLPESEGDQAFVVGERILKAVSEKSYELSKGQKEYLSVSIGVASFPFDSGNIEGLITAADEALYYCKKNGRNRAARFGQIVKTSLS